MAKIEKVKRNIIFHIIYEIIIVILGFIIPRLVIKTYGSEVNGLNSLIVQTVSVVNLLQAGIATAATYSLYMPIVKHDNRAIALIIKSTRITFRRIGVVIFFLGIIVSLPIAYLINGTITPSNIYIACFLFFIKTTLDLWFTQSIRVFLTSCQNNYLLSIGYTIEHVLYYGLTIIIIILRLNFLYMYLALLFGCFIKIFYLIIVYNRHYREFSYIILEKQKTPKIRGIKYATINEVSHTVVVATVPIIISIHWGLVETSILSIYLMIFNLITIFGKSIYLSFASSYGHVVAKGDHKLINIIFEIFQYLFFAFTSWMFMCTSILILPFIQLYTKNITEINYLDSKLMVLLIIFGSFYSFRVPYNLTISANGLFKESYLQPMLTSLLSIIVSSILAKQNYIFVLSGPILFYITNTFYQHFLLQRKLPYLKCAHFYRHLTVAFVGLLITVVFSLNFKIKISSYCDWVLKASFVALINGIIFMLLSFTIDRVSMIKTIKYFRRRLGFKHD